MGNNTETQPVGEPRTEYCRTCGHAKDTHNLDFRGDPKEAHKLYGQGDYVCQHMTGSNSAEHCICVGWSSWFCVPPSGMHHGDCSPSAVAARTCDLRKALQDSGIEARQHAQRIA